MGKHGGIEDNAVHTPLMQRMRGDFERNGASAALNQLRKIALHLRRMRRGKSHCGQLIGHAEAERSAGRARRARRRQGAHEVLPLVPVMPITRIFRLGTPYHWRAMKPARSGKSDASKLGTVHAGAACSEDGCQITAAAPRAIASSI